VHFRSAPVAIAEELKGQKPKDSTDETKESDEKEKEEKKSESFAGFQFGSFDSGGGAYFDPRHELQRSKETSSLMVYDAGAAEAKKAAEAVDAASNFAQRKR